MSPSPSGEAQILHTAVGTSQRPFLDRELLRGLRIVRDVFRGGLFLLDLLDVGLLSPSTLVRGRGRELVEEVRKAGEVFFCIRRYASTRALMFLPFQFQTHGHLHPLRPTLRRPRIHTFGISHTVSPLTVDPMEQRTGSVTRALRELLQHAIGFSNEPVQVRPSLQRLPREDAVLECVPVPWRAPDPAAPPCIRHLLLPLTAGARHLPLARVFAPQRGL